METLENILNQPAPLKIKDIVLPLNRTFTPSPADWRDEVLYFLLVDRFSDGNEHNRPMLNVKNLSAARPVPYGETEWSWKKWAESGRDRWQGGTIKGIKSKLPYLKELGVSALWLSPVFKQRNHLDQTYHGYGIQNFLEVAPQFGTRQDLVDLVSEAHLHGIKVILDIIINHTGYNWKYMGDADLPPYKHWPEYHPFGEWIDRNGNLVADPAHPEDGVKPTELECPECYTRAGFGNLGGGDHNWQYSEHKRTDFFTLRDLRFDGTEVLNYLAECYKYWIALTDCDGFRIDTVKHISEEEARNFCGAIKEFAESIGKNNFFLVGEVAGGDYIQDKYLDTLERNMNAALDIGEMRSALRSVAKGLSNPQAYFNAFNYNRQDMGTHRNLGFKHVSVLDDHDHVMGEKLRFSVDCEPEHQVTVAVAIQLYTLGIPCIYYGTEQAFAGPEQMVRQYLYNEGWGDTQNYADRYLREAMFGPEHPRQAGVSSLPGNSPDNNLPGFGPFGTAGHHCFNTNSAVYARISALNKLRQEQPALRKGRQYLRPISYLNFPFSTDYPAGELIAWSRILDTREMLCIANPNGKAARGGRILIDPKLNKNEMRVMLNTEEAANPAGNMNYRKGMTIPVHKMDGLVYVEVKDIPPAEVIVLSSVK